GPISNYVGRACQIPNESDRKQIGGRPRTARSPALLAIESELDKIESCWKNHASERKTVASAGAKAPGCKPFCAGSVAGALHSHELPEDFHLWGHTRDRAV